MLRRTLALDPGNARALLRMIDVHRGRGDLAAALKLCRRLVRLDPGHRKARWLSAVLGGGTVPEQKPSGPWPAPFVRIPDFLAPAEGERLLISALAKRERFAAATTGIGEHRKVRPSRRIGLTANDLACQDIKPWLIPRVREVLPEVMARLREEWFDPGQVRIRLQMNAYHDGGFGRPHRDPETLLGICYFHRLPKPFCGGDLVLYDTDTAKEGYRPLGFSRIEPTADMDPDRNGGAAARSRRVDGGGATRRDGLRKGAGKPRIGPSCKGKMRPCGRRARADPWPAGPDRERLERSQPVRRYRFREPGRTTSASVPASRRLNDCSLRKTRGGSLGPE